MSNFYSTCLCNATEKGGSTTTADERVEKCKATRAEQLYYTNYDAEDNPGEVSPIFPKTHAKVVLYGSSGNNIQEVIDSMKVDIQGVQAALQSQGKLHLRIADDCLTNSAVIALSARQGKLLSERIEVLQGNNYTSLSPIDEAGYLYSTEYNNYKLDNGTEYFSEHFNFIPAGCSSFKAGSLIAHNFDGVYDDYVDFLVKTPHVNGHDATTGFDVRYATVGLASKITGLTNGRVKEVATTGEHEEGFDYLPYAIVEGMNEKGLVCHLNLVKAEKGINVNGIEASEEERLQLYTGMLPRFVLDHFATAEEAIEYITSYVRLLTPQSAQDAEYDYHLFLADAEKSYALEWWEGEYHVLELGSLTGPKEIMTNFYLSDVTVNPDFKVYTPQTYTHNAGEDAVTVNNITLYGMGLERYNLIVDKLSDMDSLETMRDFLNQIKYSIVYSKDIHIDGNVSPTPFWFTEFVGGNLTVHTTTTSTEWWTTIDAIAAKFANRSRIPGTKNFGSWQTIHSVVYDIENRSIQLTSQEDDYHPFTFVIDEPSITIEKQAAQIVDLQDMVTSLQALIDDLTARVEALEEKA